MGLRSLFVLAVLMIAYYIGFVIAALIGNLLCSFYLTQDEWRGFESGARWNIPLVTPLFSKIQNQILSWKIRRENKNSTLVLRNYSPKSENRLEIIGNVSRRLLSNQKSTGLSQ